MTSEKESRADLPPATGRAESCEEGASETRPALALQRAASLAALGVLTFSNLVGLWLAALLLWPGLGRIAGPLTYGRWAPLHLDLQLYGWCSLPVIGLLLAHFLPRTPRAGAHARLALAVWCGALLAGALSWLGGGASGKLFLNWSSAAGISFALAQLFLWGVLVAGRRARSLLAIDSPPRTWADFLFLGVLIIVPVALHIASQPGIYPPVNPDSGGATGHSLLASSLGIVAIAFLLPPLLERPARGPMLAPSLAFGGVFALHWLVYAMLGHGNVSHHETRQLVGLASLLIWPLLLARWYRLFAWNDAHRRWLWSAAAWAALLVVDGVVLFLSGVLEGAKFTNAFVAHSHLAMAGLLTSLNLLMLVSLAPRSRLALALAARGPWLAWNLACLAMIGALTWLGALEMRDPLLVPSGAGVVRAFYVARLALGAVMTAAGIRWLHATIQPCGPNENLS